MRKVIIASCLVLLASTFECRAEGLDTLIELGKSQAAIQKQYADETRAFENVKKAIESGAITKGQDKAAIKSRYGEPVVVVKDLDGKREDWIYKPESSSFFKGIRATLFFTEAGLLDEARLEER